MKKFITFLSRRRGDELLAGIYRSVTNPKVQTDFAVHFPIAALMNGYAQQGEEITVVTLYPEGNEAYESSRQALEEDIRVVQARCGFTYNILPIAISEQELAYEHLQTYSRLLDAIEDGDELYVCCTFGTKPTPIIEMMAVNSAYKLKKDVAIGCVVYGKVEFYAEPKIFTIYDITSLFYMTQIANELADQGIGNPGQAIRRILQIDAFMEEDG